jgi:hypothetical protein
MPTEANHDPELVFHKITSGQEFPDWAPRERLVRFFHETMQPYHDQVPDIEAALDYALAPGREGFLMLVRDEQQLLGALTMLDSQMGGFIPAGSCSSCPCCRRRAGAGSAASSSSARWPSAMAR